MIDRRRFILVEYNGTPYPKGFDSEIKEVAAHLDKTQIEIFDNYSLHTEYSYGKRVLNSELLSKFNELRAAHKDGVPQLWKSDKWALEFSQFIIELTANKKEPAVIEIHPPFNDYSNRDLFLERYNIFEREIRKVYKNVTIVVENRSGAVYRGGKFVLGKANEITDLCSKISENGINLGVVLDFPQLLTAENIDTLKFNTDKYNNIIEEISQYKDIIQGIHIWGKKKSASGRWVAHAGDFETYFGGNKAAKYDFIAGIAKICEDDKVRYLVPEVNTGEKDLRSIINDLLK